MMITNIKLANTIISTYDFRTSILQVNYHARGHVASIDRPHLHDELQVEKVYEATTVATDDADLQSSEVCVYSIPQCACMIFYFKFCWLFVSAMFPRKRPFS